MTSENRKRSERLQVILPPDELTAIDDSPVAHAKGIGFG